MISKMKTDVSSGGKRLFFLETDWCPGGSTVFNACLGMRLAGLTGLSPLGLSVDPVEFGGFLKGLIDYPIYSPATRWLTRRRYLHDAYAVVRRHAPERLVFTINSRNCELVRHLPQHVVRIGVMHAVDVGNVELARRYSSYIDAIVSVSQLGLDMLHAKSPVPCCPCHFIPPGILMPEESFTRDGACGLPIRLLYLGRLAESAKRARSIVKIAEALKMKGVRYQWTVAGEGEEADYIAQGLDELGIREVSLIGNVSHKRVPELFAAHDVIVSTSDREAFPLSLQEAMAFGLVPVAGNAGGRVADVVPAAGGFLVDANAPEEFCEAIFLLSENRKMLADLSEKAAEAISPELGWSYISKRWQELLARPELQLRESAEWPRRLKIRPSLHRSDHALLGFVQDLGAACLSILELASGSLARRVRRFYYQMRGRFGSR